MNDISLLHIALNYLVIIRSSFARLLPKGRKNVITFFVYGIDKWRSTSGRLLPARLCRFARRRTGRKKAKKSKWRVSEATLLGLAVVGGSIGAWLGMKAMLSTETGRSIVMSSTVLLADVSRVSLSVPTMPR